MSPHQDDSLATAILQTVAYADVFDYPMTPTEIHRYLVGVEATLADVEAALAKLTPDHLAAHASFVMLPGREAIVDVRQRRAQQAARLWPRAQRYAGILSRLPFVRMVAVTGSLAVDNADDDGDIDYLIITADDRLWLCRSLVIAVVRMAALRGDIVCPNYFLSERALVLDQHSLFMARELTQMIPLVGMNTYDRLCKLNNWTQQFLPNAKGPPPRPQALAAASKERATPGLIQRISEKALRTGLGAKIERWEMQRKVRKFRRRYPNQSEAAFSPDWCKGHFEGHGQRIMGAYTNRLHSIEEPAS